MSTKKGADPSRAVRPSDDLEHVQAVVAGVVTAADRSDMEDEARLVARQAVGAAITKARGTRKREDIASALGVHRNTLAKWERGEASPDAVDVLRLASLLSCHVLQLLGQSEEEPGMVERSVQAVEVGRHIYVPRFDVQAAAGHGAFNHAEDVTDMRPFTVDYIRRTLGIPHNELAILTLVGSSMEPDIHSGDAVMVDLRDTSITIEGPHLVRIDGGLMVKIAQRRPGGVVRISSRNPTYEPFDIVLGADGQEAADFRVLGRVRWAGVTFR